MGTGMAKGLAATGRRAAFGDGRRIFWSAESHLIFSGNPNIARPGQERDGNLVWFRHYRGNRLYGHGEDGDWVWNHDFRAIPGEVYLTSRERAWAGNYGDCFVVVEPNLKPGATVNKQWPRQRYQEVVGHLRERGVRVI